MLFVFYLIKNTWETHSLKALSQKVVVKSLKVVEVVKSVATVAVETVEDPVWCSFSASIVCKLRSQVLKNHSIPQELINNIFPLSSSNISKTFIQYFMSFFWMHHRYVYDRGTHIYFTNDFVKSYVLRL